LRIYRRVSRKKYLHGKRVYEYERFYVPVPKRFQHLVKQFAFKDLRIRVEQDARGFVVRVQDLCEAKHQGKCFRKDL